MIWRCYLLVLSKAFPASVCLAQQCPAESTSRVNSSREMFLQVSTMMMVGLHLQGGRGWITYGKHKPTEEVTMIVPSSPKIHRNVYLAYSKRTNRDVTVWRLSLGGSFVTFSRRSWWVCVVGNSNANNFRESVIMEAGYFAFNIYITICVFA